ncbi:hypothetical protein JRQ81_017435, partial [Phrynocephalus forsythii]
MMARGSASGKEMTATFCKRTPSSLRMPSIEELERAMDSCRAELNEIDEVWPNLYIGSMNNWCYSTDCHYEAGDLSWFLPAVPPLPKTKRTNEHKSDTRNSSTEKGASEHLSLQGHSAMGLNVAAAGQKRELQKEMQEGDRRNRAYKQVLLELQGPQQRSKHISLLHCSSTQQGRTKKHGITHILNAAHNAWGSKGSLAFYGKEFHYHGIAAEDSVDFDLCTHFRPASKYIHKVLSAPKGKVLVHCILGKSRSASLVLAYLMIYQKFTLSEAMERVLQKRGISPNRGFLKQLQDLDLELRDSYIINTYQYTIKVLAAQKLMDENLIPIQASADRKTISEASNAGDRKAEMSRTGNSSPKNHNSEIKRHYETPALSDLQRLVWNRGGSDNHVDQVWPNLYLGDEWAARSKTILQTLGITHILNAADGPYNINTGARYYRDLPVEYYGVQAFDDNAFDISVFFHDAANFIHKALNNEGGKVFVHCAMGLSRSATLVLAYLMIHENLTLVEALKSVDSHRGMWRIPVNAVLLNAPGHSRYCLAAPFQAANAIPIESQWWPENLITL